MDSSPSTIKRRRMSENKLKLSIGGSGGGMATLLTIVFVVLRLTGEITWSWWWVLSPLLFPVGLAIVLLLALRVYIWIAR